VPVARLLGARIAVDIHTGALVDRRWRWSVPLLAWACRRAGLAIVTLPSLAAGLEARGVRTAVLPDPLPDLVPGDAVRDTADGDRPSRVVAICSWAPDEPIEALIASAAGRPWQLSITGRPRGAVEAPANVRLTGFLDDREYVDLLAEADAVVALTTRGETLLSGAWEAIALGRPLVLSDTEALRSTFGAGPPYVRSDAASIAAGIASVLADPAGSAGVAARLRERFLHENDAAVGVVAQHLIPGAKPVSR
jgi:glycosyltransferase involved in cell wall biosynthesis